MNLKRFLGLIVALTVGMTVEAQTEIGTKDELIAFATSVNNGTFGSGSAKLTADIVFANNDDWTPIGTSAYRFSGTFDGQGHKISNLKVQASGLYAGLFGYVAAGAVVKDVHVMSGTIAVTTNPGSDASHHGGIAGYNEGTIVGCSDSATVTGYSYEHARIGGIVGTNAAAGKVQNCYNLGVVYSGLTQVYIGGIVGENFGTVQNCFMKSDVQTYGGNYHKNYPLYTSNSGTITNCFYAGGTTDDAPYTGSPAPIALADDGTGNSSTLSTNHGKTKHVLLSNRTLFTDGWNTLCLPFDIPAGATGYSPIAGAKVMTLSSSSYSTSKGYGELTLNFVDATSIEAGKPYIVKWDTDFGNLSNPVFLNVTVSNTTQTTETTCVDFVGSFSPVAIAAEDKTMLYLGADNKLFYPSSAMTINSCRAYFRLKGDLVAGEPINITAIKSFNLNFGDEETTSVNEVTDYSRFSFHDGWYDLSGRKLKNSTPSELKNSKTQELKNLPPGLYIHNGRKVIIK